MNQRDDIIEIRAEIDENPNIHIESTHKTNEMANKMVDYTTTSLIVT